MDKICGIVTCMSQKSKKSIENNIFFANYLVISKKSSTFAPAFEKKHGPLAQLNRVPHYGCGGCRFESCTDHKATSNRGFFVCIYPQEKQEKDKGILKMGSTWIRHGFGNH